MLMQRKNTATMCQVFCLTLTGTSFEWFNSSRHGSIHSFQSLKDALLTRFAASMVQKKTKMSYFLNNHDNTPIEAIFKLKCLIFLIGNRYLYIP